MNLEKAKEVLKKDLEGIRERRRRLTFDGWNYKDIDEKIEAFAYFISLAERMKEDAIRDTIISALDNCVSSYGKDGEDYSIDKKALAHSIIEYLTGKDKI